MLEFIIILVVLPLTLVTLKAITERYIAANAELLMVKFIAEPSRENLDKAEDYMSDWKPDKKRMQLITLRRYGTMRQSFERKESLTTAKQPVQPV